LVGRVAHHFPQNPDGSYTGFHPADSSDALNHLKALQRGGAEYLLIPSPALWWLEHYGRFGKYLALIGDEAFRDIDCCVIFRLARSL
jgi:hypothetical protein